MPSDADLDFLFSLWRGTTKCCDAVDTHRILQGVSVFAFRVARESQAGFTSLQGFLVNIAGGSLIGLPFRGGQVFFFRSTSIPPHGHLPLASQVHTFPNLSKAKNLINLSNFVVLVHVVNHHLA